MSPYLETLLSSEVKQYIAIFVPEEYPSFIDKYIETEAMQRLDKIGQFCGCDYTKLYSCKFWYSRLHHSIVCALMTYHFTKDKVQTLAALFHDLGTPAFSHCVDYLFKDYIKQESSEKDVKEVILNSEQIIKYLKEDHISVEDVVDLSQYTVVENKKPKLCVDRLDGVLHTAYIWLHFWSLTEVKKVYDSLHVLVNEEGETEIGFCDIPSAEHFFEAVFNYSIALQENRSKYAMSFISNHLKILLDENAIKKEDLYRLSEKEIIALIEGHQMLQNIWHVFKGTEQIIEAENVIPGMYYVSVDVKKRFVMPLVQTEQGCVRLETISKPSKQLLEQYKNQNNKPYAYIENISFDQKKQKIYRK